MEIMVEQIPFVVNDLKVYAPYGEGNNRPVFHLKGLELKEYRELKTDDSFVAKCGDVKVFGFNLNEKYVQSGKPKHIDAIGYVSDNWYMGEMCYQIELIDFESI